MYVCLYVYHAYTSRPTHVYTESVYLPTPGVPRYSYIYIDLYVCIYPFSVTLVQHTVDMHR